MGVPVFQSKSAGGFISKGDTLTADFAHHTAGLILAFRSCERVVYTLAFGVSGIPPLWWGFPLSRIST